MRSAGKKIHLPKNKGRVGAPRRGDLKRRARSTWGELIVLAGFRFRIKGAGVYRKIGFFFRSLKTNAHDCIHNHRFQVRIVAETRLP